MVWRIGQPLATRPYSTGQRPPQDNRDAACRRLRGSSGRRNPEAVSWAQKREHEMLNLTFNVFGIMFTAAAIYGAMDGQIIIPIGLAFAAVSTALFANAVEAGVI
jgi:hypothetical protein